jgi:tRNA U34 2-thiouridine synthase MnmA/TrmU
LSGETGRILGTHKGTWFYTIGQRSGLGLSGGPWYVVDRDREENVVTVAGTPAAAAAAKNEFHAVNPNWISGEPELPARLTLKLRHGPKLIGADVAATGTDRLSVVMEEGDRGLAPGQFSVFYDGDVCLGGAMIEG